MLPTDIKQHRLFPSIRLLMLFLAVMGCTMLGGGFAAFNFAIVCMVNETAVYGEEVPLDSWHSSRNASDSSNLACKAAENMDTPEIGYDGTFVWDRKTQANLLAAHSWGAVWLSILSGLLSDRYGSKAIFASCIFGNLIASALTPWAASQGEPWLFAARVLQGLSTGASWPSVMAMISRWGTPADTSTLVTMGAFGFQLGPLLALASSSTICASSLRWPMIFYLWAGLSAVFVVTWLLLYTDDPSKSRLVSKEELDYIKMYNLRRLRQVKSSDSNVTPVENGVAATEKPDSNAFFSSIPWCKILLSRVALAIYTCHTAGMWVNLYIAEFLPTYGKEILQFDLKTNGLVSTLPQIFMCVTRLVIGPMAGKITCGNRSNTFSIKLYTMAAFVVPALCFLVISFLDCRHSIFAVVAFCVTGTFWSMSTISYLRSLVYVAPPYSGLMSSVSNTCAYFVGGVVMPYVIGAITQNGTLQQWRIAFWLTAAVSLIGGLQFVICGSGEEQDWAKGRRVRSDNAVLQADQSICVISNESQKVERF